MNTHRLVASALAATCAVLVTACTSTPAPLISSAYDENDPQTWTFDQVIDHALADATADGASAEQLDALNAAKKSGAVSAEQFRTATQWYLDCVDNLGASTSPIDDRSSLGQIWLDYTVSPPSGMEDAEWGPLDQQCMTTNLNYVTYVYSNQPAAREALGKALTEHEAALKQCLTDMGGEGVTEMTINEMWEALKDQSFGGEDYGYSRDKDCIIDAGINW